jgi:translation initiation factor eIF-2B subunit epsilon
VQGGESGAGYRWAVRDGGQEEEWRHSVAPIPPEKIQEIVAANREHDVEEVDYDIRALGGRDSAVGIGNKN